MAVQERVQESHMQQLQAAASQAATKAIAEAAQELAQRLPVPASGGPAPSLPSNASMETAPIPRDPREIGTQEEVLATGGDVEPIGTQENLPATGGDGDAEPIGIHTTPETVLCQGPLCQGPRLQAAAATPPHTELVQENAKRNVSQRGFGSPGEKVHTSKLPSRGLPLPGGNQEDMFKGSFVLLWTNTF